MRNVLLDERVAKALMEWLNENEKEIKEHLMPCVCDFKTLSNDGEHFRIFLHVRYEDD